MRSLSRNKPSRAWTRSGSAGWSNSIAGGAKTSRSARICGRASGSFAEEQALVGDPKTLSRRFEEYLDIGIDTFVLSGYPGLEEAYYVAELLFPKLPIRRPAWQLERLAAG